MQYRKFGRTGMLVSEIGFGAWAIGGGAMVGDTPIGWGNSDDATSIKAIHTALDAGINFFDTADIYGLGHSEKLLGKTLGNNNEIVIASKVGNVSREKKFTVDYSKEHLVKACEDSLRRLKRDRIDYLQLHSARLEHLEDGQCIKAMQLLQQQGKIRYWGVSLNTFEPLTEANWLIENELGDGFQLVLNMINQVALPLFDKIKTQQYAIIARMPLQFGLLTGKFDSGISFDNNDHRKKRITPAIVKAVNDALDPAWGLCEKYHCTKMQLALSYVLSYDEVCVVIPGIRTQEQAKENTTGIFRLEMDDRRMIEKLGEEKLNEVMDLVKAQG